MSWNKLTSAFLSSDTGIKLKDFITEERKSKTIYPEPKDMFSMLKGDILKYEDIKIVILGQDPYPSEHAHGLAFSSKLDKIPNSLKYIFDELKRDVYGYLKQETFDKYFSSPNLIRWVEQGIFLYNTILTVEKGNIGSHKDKGWEVLTELVLKKLNKHPKPIVFMLWGKYAKEYKSLITDKKHLILEAPHPNAQQYNKDAGFIGCSHFSKALRFLEETRPECIKKIKPDFNDILDKKIISERFMDMFKKYIPACELKFNKEKANELANEFVEQINEEVYITQVIDFRTSNFN